MSIEGVAHFPSGWIETTIGAVSEVNPAGSKTVTEDEDAVTFVPMAAVEALTGFIDLSERRRFKDVKKGFTRFRNGDLLFAKITPCMENGKVAVTRGLAGGIGCGSTEFHVIRPVSGMDADYLRYYVVRSAFRQEAKRNMQGAVGQQRVPPDFIRDSLLPLAPSREQKRIASKVDELFSRIEEGERALERVQTLVERYRQSVLKAAVTGELTREWREKHKAKLDSGEALLARILKSRREAWEKSELKKMKAKGQKPINDNWNRKYKEPVPPDTTDLPDLPEGWVWASLPMLCSDEISNGVSVKGSNVPPGVAALRLDAIQESGFDYSARRYIPISDEKANRLRIRAGDFFISRGNGSLRLVGRGVLADDPKERIVFPDTMIRYRLIEEPDVSDWIVKIWSSGLIRNQIESRAKTTAGIYKISQEDIAELAVPLPPLQEQAVISAAIGNRMEQAQHATTEIAGCSGSVKALRQATLKFAFAGMLVEQSPNDEPASVLLARIAAERNGTKTNDRPKRGRKKKVTA